MQWLAARRGMQVGCSTINLARVFCPTVNLAERCWRSYAANKYDHTWPLWTFDCWATAFQGIFPNRIEPISFIADFASRAACTMRYFALPQV